MNYQEINAFLTRQMKALEHTGGKEDGMVLLAMADYLLEQVQKEPGIFEQEDLGSLRKVFLRVGNLSEKVKGFYDGYGGSFKEASVKFMERIAGNMSTLEEQRVQIEKLEELLRLTEENADFEKEIEIISGLLVDAEKVNQELQSYFSENESLKKAILEEGYEDKEGFIKKLQEIEKQSEALMSSYDRILKSMLEDGERLQKKIKERQRNH